jgi:hypothetical protein
MFLKNIGAEVLNTFLLTGSFSMPKGVATVFFGKVMNTHNAIISSTLRFFE